MTEDLRRVVYCEDALAWLRARPLLDAASVITSMPDRSEFPTLTLEQWKTWFVDAAGLILSRVPSEGVSIFYQTDIKVEGHWIDKGYLVQKAAEREGVPLLWHKLVCRVAPGLASFGRPGYSHLLCFSKSLTPDLARSTADVLKQAGEVTWTRGMGVEACRAACEFVLKHTTTRTVVDPFCGHGTVLAVANEMGLEAIGVELGPKRARIARGLRAPGFKIERSTRAVVLPDSESQ